jgi:hypothetical protein
MLRTDCHFEPFLRVAWHIPRATAGHPKRVVPSWENLSSKNQIFPQTPIPRPHGTCGGDRGAHLQKAQVRNDMRNMNYNSVCQQLACGGDDLGPVGAVRVFERRGVRHGHVGRGQARNRTVEVFEGVLRNQRRDLTADAAR